MFKRLMVWRNGDVDTKWTTYRWTVVSFGDRPASCILEICKDLAADAGQHIDPQAAKAIKEDTYVDDGATGGSEQVVRRMIGEVTDIFRNTPRYSAKPVSRRR